MRAVVQRVSAARVMVGTDVVGALDLRPGAQGLVILVGVTHSDTDDHSRSLADKGWRLRILDGPDGSQVGAVDVDAPILVVSQFTLYANTDKGRRPSWNAAAPAAIAAPLVAAVVDELRSLGAAVATGVFGEQMRVDLTNDGPVTIVLDA